MPSTKKYEELRKPLTQEQVDLLNLSVSGLVEELVNLPYIEKVVAVSQNNRWVDFHVLHSHQTETDYFLPESIRGAIFDNLIDSNWKLRDETERSFYFDEKYYSSHLISQEDFLVQFEGEKVIASK